MELLLLSPFVAIEMHFIVLMCVCNQIHQKTVYEFSVAYLRDFILSMFGMECCQFIIEETFTIENDYLSAAVVRFSRKLTKSNILFSGCLREKFNDLQVSQLDTSINGLFIYYL